MRASKFFLAILLLVSCSRGVEEKRSTSEGAATFIVDPLIASGQEGGSDATFGDVATSRQIQFTACLKDVAVLEPVVGAEFLVRDGEKRLHSSATDAKGCLHWSEKFTFQATRPETFSEVERTIEATTVHNGRVALRIAINPWKKGSEAVKDLRFEAAPPALDRSATASLAEKNGLVVDSVAAQLEVVRSADAVAEANLEISFEPKLRRLGLDGRPILESLNSGKFSLRLQLISRSPERLIPLSQIEISPATPFSRGRFQHHTRVKILKKIPRESTLELAFEAAPVDGPEGLYPLSGTVSLGRLTSLSISKNAPLRLDLPASFSESKQEVTNEPSTGSSFGFEIGRVRVNDVVVKSLDSTGNPSSLELELTTCLRNSISQEKILKQAFTLQFAGETEQVSTDAEDGCLTWHHIFPFDYHARESFIKTDLVVASNNEFYGREKVSRVAHLNLWKYESPAKIAVDEELDGAPAASVAETGSGSELLLSNASFSFLGRAFEVDERLNLSTTRRYRFEIQPKIRRLSRDRGWLPPQGSGNGRYQVRFLLESLDPNQPRVIDARVVEAESRADTITTTVDFKLNDLRLVASRLNLSVEVLPLDRASSLATQPYSGTFDMGGFSIRLEPRGSKIDERMKETKRDQGPGKPGLELFAAARGHTLLDAAKLASMGLQPADLEKALASGDKRGLGKLCSLYFDPNGWFSSYKSCAFDPESFLAMGFTEHVRGQVQSKPAGNPQTSTLSMSAAMAVSEYESNDESNSKSRAYAVDSGARLSVPLLDLIGLNIGIGVGVSDSWNSSKSFTKGRSHSTTRSADQSRQIQVDEAKFQITAEVDRCVVVGNKAEAKNKPVYMACAPKPTQKTFPQTYFLLYQNSAGSALIDSGGSLEDRPFMALIRGRARFQQFSAVLRDPEATVQLTRTLPAPAEVMREAENRFDGFFPGLLTPGE